MKASDIRPGDLVYTDLGDALLVTSCSLSALTRKSNVKCLVRLHRHEAFLDRATVMSMEVFCAWAYSGTLISCDD